MQRLDNDVVRQRLEQRRAELEDIRQTFQQETAAAMAGPGGAELSAIDQHPADLGTDTFERSKEVSILSSVERGLADVQFASDQLALGTYGRCQACGRPIGEERLEARPEARYCIDDQALAERSD
jgi:RNA polymerase-binding transcription factor DksA